MNRPHLILLCAALLTAGTSAAETPGPAAPERLQRGLERFPAADTGSDGRLSIAEARQFARMVRGRGQPPASAPANRPAPTHAGVPYGPHKRQVLDLWLATPGKPAPLIVFIHGGGFTGGDKANASPAAIQACRNAGVAFAAINYRFLQHAPIQEILRDSARAIQFLRLRSSDYGLDPARFACFGSSAGGGASLWLAVRDDSADPASADPVLRQSSRIAAAGGINLQASYDLTEWESFLGEGSPDWLRHADEDVQFYHFRSRADLATPEGLRVLADCSMLRQISRDDPPLVLANTYRDAPPSNRGEYLHHPSHVTAVQRRCQEAGVRCEAHHLGSAGQPRGDATRLVVNFLLGVLGSR